MKRMKTNTTENKNMRYGSAIGVTVILEILLYVIVIGSTIAMVASLGCAIHFYIIRNIGCGNQWMTLFGIFATVSFVPLLGFVATMISAYRNSLSEIEGDLAKCTGIEVQFRQLPRSANIDTYLELQQSVKEERKVLEALGFDKEKLDAISENIVDYAYQVVLDFKQDLAELYTITLCDLKFVDDDAQVKIIRNKESIMNSISIVKALSGLKRNVSVGEHACVFVRRDESNESTIENLINLLNNGNTPYRRLVCTLNFQKREFLGKKRVFPISRMLLDSIMRASFRRKMFVTIFDFDALKPRNHQTAGTTFKNFVYDLNITNISFIITHDLSWSDYLVNKFKLMAGEVENEINK